MATLKTSAAQEAAPVTPAAAAGYMPTNLRDAAYMGAHSSETLGSCARFLLNVQPNVLEAGIAEDNLKQLRSGWETRYSELHSGQRYMVKEGKYIPIDDKAEVSQGTETAFFTIGTATAYTQQAFGKLKSEEPEKHSIVKQWREAFQKYCSNRANEMLAILRRAEAAKEPRTRKTNDWVQSAAELFQKMKDQRKNKHSKGDTTAPAEAKLLAAIAAFYAALNAE
jgi:hypothetical protein